MNFLWTCDDDTKRKCLKKVQLFLELIPKPPTSDLPVTLTLILALKKRLQDRRWYKIPLL